MTPSLWAERPLCIVGTALHSTCIVYMWDYGSGVRAAPTLLFVVCLPSFTTAVESADETAEVGCLLFLRQHVGEGKMRCQSVRTDSAFASNVDMKTIVLGSILSHRSRKIKVSEGGLIRLRSF